jgi:hypothetical protein
MDKKKLLLEHVYIYLLKDYIILIIYMKDRLII